MQWRPTRSACYGARMLVMLLTLVLAAFLEVGGLAAIRRGLVGSATPWLALGGVALLLYGFTVNVTRTIDFGRLMGVYIAVFFLVSQAISVGLFAERPAREGAASLNAALTIRLALVRMPSRCARTTAWLMECERPKSSALTMSRRPGLMVTV